MRILIDADGCPVVSNTIAIANKYKIEVIIICDTSHIFEREGAETITVSKGADSVDFVLANMIKPNDIVITQDYGLAAMCLAKKAVTLSQNGLLYNDDNIDALLSARYTAKKARMSGQRIKGNKKRTSQQDIEFEAKLISVLESMI